MASEPSSQSDAFSHLLNALAAQHRHEVLQAMRAASSAREDLQAAALPTPAGAAPFSQPSESAKRVVLLGRSSSNLASTVKPPPPAHDPAVVVVPDELPHQIIDDLHSNRDAPIVANRSLLTWAKRIGGISTAELPKRHSRKSASMVPDSAVGSVVKSSAFEKISIAALLANSILIGIQVQYELSRSTPGVVLALDYMFCIFFLIELLLRLWGFGCRHFWLDEADRAWNWFDVCIVAVSTLDAIASILMTETSMALRNISIVRLVRIIRTTRVLRIIRMESFKDLRILLAAIASTLQTGIYAFVLIILIMWIFSVAITQLVAHFVVAETDSGRQTQHDDLMIYFGSVWTAFFTLFMTISGGIDWRDAAVPLLRIPMGIVFYMVYIVLMVLCIMNVLTGMFCQAAMESAQRDRDRIIEFQLLDRQRYVQRLSDMFGQFDDSGDGKCTLVEFERHLADTKMQALLRSLDIEVRDALLLFELLDNDGSGEIDMEEFITGCITLRGPAKAVHVEKLKRLHDQMSRKMAEAMQRT
eukprot:TRINITY_DN5833_c0_g1_i1.p1 TRINITY_DN5833_c0_g1~~TRINITY_DN5833_c0_g1_i1.p1  ORF type:complete len:530 (+),score=90.81 TRINITY_DN5833_c0_g1_i1:119-1708(+)